MKAQMVVCGLKCDRGPTCPSREWIHSKRGRSVYLCRYGDHTCQYALIATLSTKDTKDIVRPMPGAA